MQWLNNIMNWGQSSIQSQEAGQAGYGLGQPIVTGTMGSATYADGTTSGSGQGVNWGGLLYSAAKGYNQAQANQPQVPMAQSSGMGFGSPYDNPGAGAISGLLLSHQNKAQS